MALTFHKKVYRRFYSVWQCLETSVNDIFDLVALDNTCSGWEKLRLYFLFSLFFVIYSTQWALCTIRNRKYSPNMCRFKKKSDKNYALITFMRHFVNYYFSVAALYTGWSLAGISMADHLLSWLVCRNTIKYP